VRDPTFGRRRGLTREQLAKLLEVLPEPVRALAITVAMTGPRIGEVFALRRRNLDFERSIIHVHESIYIGGTPLRPSPRAVFEISRWDRGFSPARQTRHRVLTCVVRIAAVAHNLLGRVSNRAKLIQLRASKGSQDDEKPHGWNCRPLSC